MKKPKKDKQPIPQNPVPMEGDDNPGPPPDGPGGGSGQ